MGAAKPGPETEPGGTPHSGIYGTSRHFPRALRNTPQLSTMLCAFSHLAVLGETRSPERRSPWRAVARGCVKRRSGETFRFLLTSVIEPFDLRVQIDMGQHAPIRS